MAKYSKTYSNQSNCRRAARKAGLDQEDIFIKRVDGGFAFRLPTSEPEKARKRTRTVMQDALADLNGEPDPRQPVSGNGAEPKADSKAAQAITAMRAEGGVTGAELQAMLGWAGHTVRGFISGTLRKKMGLDVTAQREGKTTRYSLPAA